VKSKSIKIFLNYILGPLVFIWLSVSVYHQLAAQPDLSSKLNRLKGILENDQAWKVWVVILLVLVNWGLEAWKWQLLMKPLEGLSFCKAFKATLSGVAFALNTPKFQSITNNHFCRNNRHVVDEGSFAGRYFTDVYSLVRLFSAYFFGYFPDMFTSLF